MGWIVALVLALIVCRTVFSFVISWLRNEKTKYDKAKSETTALPNVVTIAKFCSPITYTEDKIVVIAIRAHIEIVQGTDKNL